MTESLKCKVFWAQRMGFFLTLAEAMKGTLSRPNCKLSFVTFGPSTTVGHLLLSKSMSGDSQLSAIQRTKLTFTQSLAANEAQSNCLICWVSSMELLPLRQDFDCASDSQMITDFDAATFVENFILDGGSHPGWHHEFELPSSNR